MTSLVGVTLPRKDFRCCKMKVMWANGGQVFIILCILCSPHLCLSLRFSLCFLSILNSIQLRRAGTKAKNNFASRGSTSSRFCALYLSVLLLLLLCPRSHLLISVDVSIIAFRFLLVPFNPTFFFVRVHRSACTSWTNV